MFEVQLISPARPPALPPLLPLNLRTLFSFNRPTLALLPSHHRACVDARVVRDIVDVRHVCQTAVALGAALHAGLMVGSVRQGIEMNDGGYVVAQHGRTSGFQVAAAGGWGKGGFGSSIDPNIRIGGATRESQPELVWEP